MSTRAHLIKLRVAVSALTSHCGTRITQIISESDLIEKFFRDIYCFKKEFISRFGNTLHTLRKEYIKIPPIPYTILKSTLK